MDSKPRLRVLVDYEWTVARPCARAVCPHLARDRGLFCSDRCRRLDNRDKWKQAPRAAVDAIRKWTGWTESGRLLSAVEDAFEWLGATNAGQQRRARLMMSFGLTWEEGRWQG